MTKVMGITQHENHCCLCMYLICPLFSACCTPSTSLLPHFLRALVLLLCTDPSTRQIPQHGAHRVSASLVTHPAWIRPQLCLLHPSKTCPSPGQLENHHRQSSQPVLVLNYTQTTISPKLSHFPSSEINPKLFYELLK